MANRLSSAFHVAEMHYEGAAMKRFVIIEKVHTIDGPRDRITNKVFGTLEEAKAYIEREENR